MSLGSLNEHATSLTRSLQGSSLQRSSDTFLRSVTPLLRDYQQAALDSAQLTDASLGADTAVNRNQNSWPCLFDVFTEHPHWIVWKRELQLRNHLDGTGLWPHLWKTALITDEWRRAQPAVERWYQTTSKSQLGRSWEQDTKRYSSGGSCLQVPALNLSSDFLQRSSVT